MQVHSTVKKRWLDGDELVRSCMAEVAHLAVLGQQALLQQDFHTIAELMNRNFDLRRSIQYLVHSLRNFSMYTNPRELLKSSQ
jgi:galactokinase/mevalonate kinase-like predicted kinase